MQPSHANMERQQCLELLDLELLEVAGLGEAEEVEAATGEPSPAVSCQDGSERPVRASANDGTTSMARTAQKEG